MCKGYDNCRARVCVCVCVCVCVQCTYRAAALLVRNGTYTYSAALMLIVHVSWYIGLQAAYSLCGLSDNCLSANMLTIMWGLCEYNYSSLALQQAKSASTICEWSREKQLGNYKLTPISYVNWIIKVSVIFSVSSALPRLETSPPSNSSHMATVWGQLVFGSARALVWLLLKGGY